MSSILKQNKSTWLAAIPVFFLPLPASWFTAVLLLCIILGFAINYKQINRKALGWIPFVFVLMFCSYLYKIWEGESFSSAVHLIRNKFYYLLIPLVFIYKGINVQFLKRSWIFGCLTVTSMLLLAAAIRFGVNLNAREFYYGYLSMYGHPSYLGLIFLLGFVFLFQERDRLKGAMVAGGLLALGMVLLSSRAIHLAGLGALALLIIKAVIDKSGYAFLLGVILISAVSFTALKFSTGKGVERSTQAFKEMSGAQPRDNKSSGNVRIDMWQSVYNHMPKYSPFGVGMENVKTSLHADWQEDGIGYLIKRDYSNVHNQFLQQIVIFGWMGLLSLLALVFSPLILAKKDMYGWIWSLILTISLFFECIVERQMGVTTVVLLVCCLSYQKFNNHDENSIRTT